MSELKEHQFCESDEFFREYPGPLSNELRLYYLKSEADKVIEELEADYKEACGRLQTANLIKDEKLDELRHHKLKRCLAMAKWCECKRIDAADDRIPREKWDFYGKWNKCWLKIAEKFKEDV